MKLSRAITIHKSADAVWNILGPNYANAGDWASAVFISQPKTGTPKVAGAPVEGRTCETSLGPFTESIVAYDEDKRYVAYSASGAKMPGFMRSLTNAWTVTPVGPNRCNVSMELNADIAPPFNILMGWMMKLQFSGALTDSIEDLKYYAETGKQSAKKLAADASKKGVTARAMA